MEQAIVMQEAPFEVQWMSMPIDPSKTPKQANAVNAKRGDKISRVPITLRIVFSKQMLQRIELQH